ncbi:MAG: cytochrome c biogenesis protein CcdA [Acidimicrobiales bacterium]
MNPGAYVALFGAGVASFTNPCVLPLVPAYVGMMAGDEARRSPHRRVIATAFFVSGFTAVFAGLGLVAEIAGRNVDALLNSIQRIGGIALVVLGLIQLGAIRRLRTASWRLNPRLPTGPVTRPLVMGITFGAAWTPCVGPLLGAALVSAAHSSTKFQGISLLVAYAVGVGVPFVAASLALESAPAVTRRLQPFGRALHYVAGATLIVLGLLLTTDHYDAVTSLLARIIAT